MKNPNNYGTVTRLPGKRRKPFAVRITTGWIQKFDDDGKPVGRPTVQRKYIGYYATRREALSALARFNSERESDVEWRNPRSYRDTPKMASISPYVPTFEQMWKQIRRLKADTLAKTTLWNYDNSYDRCFSLRHKRIDTITYMDLQKIMNEYMKEGHTAGSLKLFKVFLSLVFGEAVKMNYIASSPAQFVTYKATKEKRQKQVIPADVIERIAQSDCRTKDTVAILLYTGLRIEELLRIDPKNIHLDEHYIIAGSKTAAGKNRVVPIHPCIDHVFRRWMHDARPGYTRMTELLKYDCRDAYGMPFTFHECRHTFITRCKQAEIPDSVIKRIVGHSTSDVTEAVYTHYDPEYLYQQLCRLPSIDFE